VKKKHFNVNLIGSWIRLDQSDCLGSGFIDPIGSIMLIIKNIDPLILAGKLKLKLNLKVDPLILAGKLKLKLNLKVDPLILAGKL
jgi:hypothetical protein